jgi:hypothetical protein
MRDKILLLAVVLSICNETIPSQDNDKTGQINVNGKYIQTITFANSQNQKYDISNPDTPVSLPAGDYYIRNIKLTGGFECSYPGISVNVKPGETSQISAGAPLKQHIEVSRMSGLLKLRHRITGAGGEEYTPVGTKQKPVFTISQNGEEIFSDSFEYG